MNVKLLRALADEIGEEAHRYTKQTGGKDELDEHAQRCATASLVLGAISRAINAAVHTITATAEEIL